MAISYVDILTKLKTLINENNTTTATYNLKAGLNRTVGRIYQGCKNMHDHVPLPAGVHHGIYVELDDVTEEPGTLGPTNKRDSVISFDIVPVTNYGAGSDVEGYAAQNAHMENIRLCQNLMYMFRNKIDLTNTVAFQRSLRTEFASLDNDDQAYNIVSRITIQAEVKNTT